MIKTMHCKTNYRKLIDKLSSLSILNFRRMGTYVQIIPLSAFSFRIIRNNDVIDFYIDMENEIAIPTHVTNIIEDKDYDTFISGKKLYKRHLMVEADEKLYFILRDADIWYPVP